MTRLREVILPWEGTPYASGQCLKGSAVDCIRFGAAVMDELCGWERELPTNLPLDTAMHSPETARAALRRLLRIYPELDHVEREEGVWMVEPGDLIVTGPEFGGPGHLIMVGWAPGTCWEASSPEVRQIGIGLDQRQCYVFHVLRHRNRLSWI